MSQDLESIRAEYRRLLCDVDEATATLAEMSRLRELAELLGRGPEQVGHDAMFIRMDAHTADLIASGEARIREMIATLEALREQQRQFRAGWPAPWPVTTTGE